MSDLSPPNARLLKCLYKERAAISLFDALYLDENGAVAFPESTISQVAATVGRFLSIAVNNFQVPLENINVFATEAMRRASNAAGMLEAIHKAAPGLKVHVVATEVESLFGAMGARSSFVDVKGLFLDLGGGSVQMTYMDSSAPQYEIAAAQAGRSLPFGAAALTKTLNSTMSLQKSAEISKLQDGMKDVFAKLQSKFPDLASSVRLAAATQDEDQDGSSGLDIYLCGGGFRGYGSMLMHSDPVQPYPIPAVGAYTVSGEYFSDTKKMRDLNKNYQGKIFGVSKRRRSQFPAIATVVDAVIDAVPRIRSVTFCIGGNREGSLLMMMPRDVREANPLMILTSKGLSYDPAKRAMAESILQILRATLPASFQQSKTATVLTPDIGPLFVSRIWGSTGESDEANAAAVIHDAVRSDPSAPGLTHMIRAILGLTLCARYGAYLGPIDKQLHDNMKAIVAEADPNANFWAEYIGAAAAALAKVVPVWPRSVEELGNTVRQVTP